MITHHSDLCIKFIPNYAQKIIKNIFKNLLTSKLKCVIILVRKERGVIYINTERNNNQKFNNVPQLGEIYYADLPKNSDSIQAGIRPVVILQESKVLKNNKTWWVMPLSTEIKAMHLPTHKLIKRSPKNGLRDDSITIGEHMQEIPKRLIISEKIGNLEPEYIPVVGEVIMNHFTMTKYAVGR